MKIEFEVNVYTNNEEENVGFPALGPVSQKSRELCGHEKPFLKVRPAYSVKLVFHML